MGHYKRMDNIIWNSPVPIKPAITSQEDFDRFTPPDPLADYRYNTLRALVKRFKGKRQFVFAHDAWEYPSAFRGTAELLTDFILILISPKK